MLTRDEILKILRRELPTLKEQFGVERMAIYGSFAEGIADEQSDIDILVEVSKPLGFKFVSLAYYLEESLGREVNLATFGILQKSLIKRRYANIASEIEKSLSYV